MHNPIFQTSLYQTPLKGPDYTILTLNNPTFHQYDSKISQMTQEHQINIKHQQINTKSQILRTNYISQFLLKFQIANHK